MATLNGLFTLGKDATIRQTGSGDSVASLDLVYNYGKKENGEQPAQWIRASLWGARADSLSQYLTKGKQFYMSISDVNVRSYESNGKTGASLEGRVVDLEFTRGKSEGQEQRQAPQRQAAPQNHKSQAPQQRAPSGFDDMDDDIPFADPMRRSLGLYNAI